MSKTPYDIVIGEDYEDAEGNKKTKWYTVGVAFELDNGGFSCEPAEGIALTGRFLLKERKPKATT